MSQNLLFRLRSLTIIDLIGADATAILHNLTTNDVKSLTLGDRMETFITDVRGKTLGHVQAARLKNGFRLVGAPGQSDAIVAHLDRYTIREDATPTIRDSEFAAYVLPPDASLGTLLDSIHAPLIPVEWLGKDSHIFLVPRTGDESGVDVEVRAKEREVTIGGEAEFHAYRTRAGFPWHGVDFDEKNLPQETARHDAICFTKGCYLGQETVARLDALGQVQKQLVRWSVNVPSPEPGTELFDNDKLVGRLTSIAPDGPEKSVAIGIARRSHFEPGSVATADGMIATVLG